MATLYTQNSEKWKTLSSIDYFTHFVKAWIPFNAWYKNYYPDCRTDRQAIDLIKGSPNNFKNKLISLLTHQSTNGVSFRVHVAELHQELENNHIFNRDERINFIEVAIENNSTPSYSFSHSGCKYEVKKSLPNRQGEIDIFFYKKNGSLGFSYTQTNGFDLQDLTANIRFNKLTTFQQKNLRACYEEINPRKPISLLSNSPNIGIEMGSVRFIEDTDILAKGIIEILYKLRNTLFHGEVVPDNNANKVYEPAYQILHILIQAL
jgi:hypothetical protein